MASSDDTTEEVLIVVSQTQDGRYFSREARSDEYLDPNYSVQGLEDRITATDGKPPATIENVLRQIIKLALEHGPYSEPVKTYMFKNQTLPAFLDWCFFLLPIIETGIERKSRDKMSPAAQDAFKTFDQLIEEFAAGAPWQLTL
jgi:hypothetical protein